MGEIREKKIERKFEWKISRRLQIQKSRAEAAKRCRQKLKRFILTMAHVFPR